MYLKWLGKYKIYSPAVYSIKPKSFICNGSRRIEGWNKDVTKWGWSMLPEITVCVNNTLTGLDHLSKKVTCRELLHKFGYLMSNHTHIDGQLRLIYSDTKATCFVCTAKFPPSAIIFVPAGWAKMVLKLIKLGVISVAPKQGDPRFMIAHMRDGSMEYINHAIGSWNWVIQGPVD